MPERRKFTINDFSARPENRQETFVGKDSVVISGEGLKVHASPVRGVTRSYQEIAPLFSAGEILWKKDIKEILKKIEKSDQSFFSVRNYIHSGRFTALTGVPVRVVFEERGICYIDGRLPESAADLP